MYAAPTSSGYFAQPQGGSLVYMGDSFITAPDYNADLQCIDCPDVNATGDGIWSQIGSAVGGFFEGFFQKQPVNVNIGGTTTQPKPAQPAPTQVGSQNMMYLWLAIVALALILLLRK